MSNTRAFKIITHLSEAASLEEELFAEKDEEYAALYSRDFSAEDEFLREMGPAKIEAKHDKNVQPSSIKEALLKLLYRKLAHKTHPDVRPDGTEEFRKIREAFEKKDGPALLTAALNNGVEVQIDEADVKDMMSDVRRRRQQTEDKKMKKYIRAALQIDEAKFQEWLTVRKIKG
jgi:hypothetical protein